MTLSTMRIYAETPNQGVELHKWAGELHKLVSGALTGGSLWKLTSRVEHIKGGQKITAVEKLDKYYLIHRWL